MRAYLVVFLISLLFTSCSKINKPEYTAEFGSTPTVNGIFADGEWDDANIIKIDSMKSIRLKHDNENIYFALDGDGGNIYFLRENKMTVLHASFSLGWTDYIKQESSSWSCVSKYEWELYKLQDSAQNIIDQTILKYGDENGWSGSLIPMGNKYQTEFAVSFKWLGIDQNSKSDYTPLPKILICSFMNMPRDECEIKGITLEMLKTNWPITAAPIDSLNRGYCPESISLDTSHWGEIFIRL